MAYSQDPRQSTYQDREVFLLKEYNSRDSGFAKDIDYVNVFFEVTKNKTTGENTYNVFFRPGLTQFSAVLQSTNVRQIYYWEERQKYYVWVDSAIQIVNGTTGVVEATIAGALGTSSGPVGVTEFLYDNGDVKLVFTDGTSLKTIDSANTIVASTSPDKPATILTSMVFIDGYLFVVKADTADIYNSNLNDPLAFTAGDFISAEMKADKLSYLAALNNYLVAFGSSSIEYFWDAANATGSPLQRNDTPIKFNGFLGGLAQTGNKIYFVGNTNENFPSVFVLEDFKIQEVGEDNLRRQLEANTSSYSNYAGNIVAVNGHIFYVLTADQYTYVVDVETNLYTRWTGIATTTLPVLYSANGKTSTTYYPVVYVQGSQYLDKFNKNTCLDYGLSYTATIVTGLEDFDSYHEKSMGRLVVVGDRPTVNTDVSLSWTDDDYQTYSTPRTINMNQYVPDLQQLGFFRRRAFKLSCQPTVPFRIQYFKVSINIGAS